MRNLVAGNKQPALRSASLLIHLVAAVVLSGVLGLIVAQSASAHAELLRTTPEDGAVLEQAPAEAVLTFNEPVQLLDSSSTRLFPGDEAPLDLDSRVSDTEVVASLPGDLADGSYALSYRVVSADGHPISGAITFTIGHADSPASAPAIETETPQATLLAVRVLTSVQYLTLLAFVGLAFFDRAVLRRTRSSAGGSGRVQRGAGIAVAVVSVLLIPASALNVTGNSLGALLSPSAWWSGVLWAPVAAAGLVLLGVIGNYVLRNSDLRGVPGRVLRTAAPSLALVAPALVGHSQTVEPRFAMILADIGHLLAGSFWFGGVIGLLFFLAGERPVRRGGPSGAGPIPALAVVERFSRFAIWSVALLGLSGILMGVLILGSVELLVTTAYGVTLLVKIGIVALIIAIAGYNRFQLLPALATQPTARKQWRHLARSLTGEAALLVVVLAVTGFVTNLSPGHEHHDDTAETHAAAAPVTVSGEAQELAVEGEFEPASTGENHITFVLRYEGEPVTPEAVTVDATLPEHDLGPFETVAELDAGTGAYSAQLELPVAGDWQVQVTARVSTFTEPVVTVPVTIR